MTATERKALAASLTPEEREKFTLAIDNGLIDELASRGEFDMSDPYTSIDAALLEATKDRPKEPELGPFLPEGDAESWYTTFEGNAEPVNGYQRSRDEKMTANGNCFPTKEAAEREARYTRAHRRLRQIAAVLNAKPTETLGNTRYGFRLGRDCGVVVTTTGFGGMIGGAVTFNHRDDAERAMRQLESEGISLTDLFPED